MVLPILSLRKLIIDLPDLSSSVINLTTSSCYKNNIQHKLIQEEVVPYNMLNVEPCEMKILPPHEARTLPSESANESQD
jgi:hypothetical protein